MAALILDRRRFLGSAACYVGAPLLLGGCGGSSGGGGTVVTPPAPSPSPQTPAPAPAPAPAPTSTPVPSNALKIAFAGSSSSAQYLTNYGGPPDNPAVLASSDGLNFETLSSGAFGKVAGTSINNATGRPVYFIRGGMAGASLAAWAATSSPQRDALVARIKAAGGVDAVLLQVGRNDAADGTIISFENQTERLRSLVRSIRSEAGVPNAMIFIGASQDMIGGTAVQRRQLGWQRLAELAVVASEPNVRYGFSTYDLATVDNTHQTEASQQISGTRFAGQVIAWLKGTGEQRGPQIVGVRLVSPTQTDVTFKHNAGTDFSRGYGYAGFEVKPEGSDAILPITSTVRQDSKTVRLTHQPRDNRSIRLSYALEQDVDDTLCLRDNSANQLPAEPYLSVAL